MSGTEAAAREAEQRHLRRAAGGAPASDDEVRRRLRALGEPVTRFGEGAGERRNRLASLVAQRGDADGALPSFPDLSASAASAKASAASEELFFTDGPPALATIRTRLALSSLQRARQRLVRQRSLFQTHGFLIDPDRSSQTLDQSSSFEALRSAVVDSRPASSVSVSPSSTHAAVASWSGSVRIFSLEGFEHVSSAKMGPDRITGVSWRPHAPSPGSHTGEESPVSFAAGCADGNAGLFTFSGHRRAVLSGHGDRLARVAFHPDSHLLATASFDHTWRLWDVEAEKELLAQEGHSRGVYAVRFHPDGSLACSVGLDGHGWVWDLRTGRSIWALQGHHKQALSVDFAPNGHDIATGGEDNTIRVWDLRKKECVYVIPAHTSSISSLTFEPTAGAYLASSSFDKTIRLWDARTFKLNRILEGHDNKVMSSDVLPDGSAIVSASYDRTMKLWAQSLA